MRVDTNGFEFAGFANRNYKVIFQYLHRTTELPEGDCSNVHTVARIFRTRITEDSEEEVANEIANSIAICHPRDQFCKRVGRKLAFERAVQQAFPGRMPEAKALRRLFWDKFLTTCKI